MTHVSDERKAQLDAAAAERAPVLEEQEHLIAGLGQKHLLDGPQPYHAGQLTPAYHVPGNVAPDPAPAPAAEPSATDLDTVAAEDSAKEQTSGNA